MCVGVICELHNHQVLLGILICNSWYQVQLIQVITSPHHMHPIYVLFNIINIIQYKCIYTVSLNKQTLFILQTMNYAALFYTSMLSIECPVYYAQIPALSFRLL